MIDSKPIQPPYLNLIPLKEYPLKEQELAMRNVIGKDNNQKSSYTMNDMND